MRLKSLLVVLALFFCFSCAQKVVIGGWDKVPVPTRKAAQVYGSYTAGCVDGAESLPASGEGYEVISYDRGRFYGHPVLMKFIREYAAKLSAEKGSKILISDIAQPRGGPAPLESSHRSHQTGLDVDIWFHYLKKGQQGSGNVSAVSMLTADEESLSVAKWKSSHIDMLQVAALFENVERIFVNPHIKRELCRTNKGEEWLSKVRPWWGHHEHFHVRLRCPADSKYCEKQAPVTKGDGCDDSLAWWFSEEAKAKAVESAKEERAYPQLPGQCKAVFEWREASVLK